MDIDRAVIEVVTRGDGDEAITRIVRFFLAYQLMETKKDAEFFCEKKPIARVRQGFEILSATSSRDLAQFEPRYDERLRKIFGEIPRGKDRVYPEVRTTIEVEDIYLDGFLRLLLFLKHLGSVGGSRGILVRVDPKAEPSPLCGWDGDGSDKMTVLTINGEDVEKTGRGYGFNEMMARRVALRYLG